MEEYYFSFLLDRAEPAVPLHRQRRGRRRDRGGRQDQPRRRQPDPDRPGHRRRRGEGPGDRRGGEVPRAGSSTRPWPWCWRSGQVFVEEDATLVEVNPLARLEGDKLEALDGKVSLDDNADFRHPDHAAFEIKDETDPLEAKAKEKGLNYVKLDGEVGIIGNGAGLVMSTLDVVAYAGERHGGVKPANFLDIGGGANAQVMADGLDVIIHDEQVKAVFVNVFGGITACDEVANGIKGALEILGDEATKPLVVRLDGNNVAEGRRILDELNHPLVTQVDTMDGAADKAAELAHAPA